MKVGDGIVRRRDLLLGLLLLHVDSIELALRCEDPILVGCVGLELLDLLRRFLGIALVSSDVALMSQMEFWMSRFSFFFFSREAVAPVSSCVAVCEASSTWARFASAAWRASVSR